MTSAPSIDPVRWIYEADGTYRSFNDGVIAARMPLIEQRVIDMLDLLEGCAETYPAFKQRFDAHERKELVFAEADSSICLLSHPTLAEKHYKWRQRLNMVLIKQILAADPTFETFELETRLKEELEEHHKARMKIAQWGVYIRDELTPIVRRLRLGMATMHDCDSARALHMMMRSQIKNMSHFVG